MGHVRRVVWCRPGGETATRDTLTTMLLTLMSVAVLAVAAVFFAGGCASEEDLALRLQTATDPLERQKTAVVLAGKHSLAATQRVATAARSDSTAAVGLSALRDEYVILINGIVDKAHATREDLDTNDRLAVQEAIDCLALIGDPQTLEALGALACKPEIAKADTSGNGWWKPDILELQLRALQAVAMAENAAAALPVLVDAAYLSGKAISTVAVRDAAVTALADRPDAVTALFEARAAAPGDQAVVAALDGALAGLGGPAVRTLVDAMAEQDWADEILADIGEPALDLVTRELHSDNSRVRFRALGVLLRVFLKDEAAVRGELVRAELIPLLIDARTNATYGDERDDAAETVLALIGEPAVEPLMELLMSKFWVRDVLAAMGAPAVPALTAALGNEDRNLRFAAADILIRIKNAEPTSVEALTAGLEDEDLKTIAATYAYYIRLGQAGTEEILSKALRKYGSKEMVVDYLNCGNELLDAAARKWAADHGYEVYTEQGVHSGPQWGEGG